MELLEDEEEWKKMMKLPPKLEEVVDGPRRMLWCGQFSVAYSNGPILRYLREVCGDDEVMKVYVPSTDGNNDEELPEGSVMATLAQNEEKEGRRYLYLPFDDLFFDHGVVGRFEKLVETFPFMHRRKKLYWRGGASGGGLDSIRGRTVAALIDDTTRTDVKLTRWGGWEKGKGFPDRFFAPRVDVEVYFLYRFVMVLDGNVTASSLMWTFASGAVPVVVTAAKTWMSEFMISRVNCILIKPDLSDLRAQLDWLFSLTDVEAAEIAESALQLAKDHFNPQAQRDYLFNALQQFKQ